MSDKREEIEKAVTLAMSWHPSENGPSYAETRTAVVAMLSRALSQHGDATGADAERINRLRGWAMYLDGHPDAEKLNGLRADLRALPTPQPATAEPGERKSDIIRRLVDEVISVCEPENADEKATAYTRQTLTEKFNATLPAFASPKPDAVGAEREACAKALEPIDTAPKDGTPILAWCDHEADPYVEDEKTGRLTIYGAHAEGLSFAPTGYHIVVWGGAFDDRDYFNPNEANLPDWWFVDGSEFERAANPTHWMPLPAAIRSRSAP